MHVTRLETVDQLRALAPEWDALRPRTPFLSIEWLTTWWRYYGLDHRQASNSAPRRELFVLAALDDDGHLQAAAPWYVERTLLGGRVVRFLGDGDVCADYLTCPCRPGAESAVAAALAEWLLDDRPTLADWLARERHDGWDLLQLGGVDRADEFVLRLTGEMARRGAITHSRTTHRCWRIELPETWDDYLARLSKSHRKRVRRLERAVFASGRARMHEAKTVQDLDQAFSVLIDLHQRRWRARGEPGVFASAPFRGFHREVAEKLLAAGQVSIAWLELDGRPIAAEHRFLADGVVYAYQSGIDPAAADDEPGNLSAVAHVRSAIESGFRAYDFLRGDEPYKAHWRAEPHEAVELRIAPASAANWLRHTMWIASRQVRDWLRPRSPAPVASSSVADGE